MERDTNIAFIPKAPLTTGAASSRPTSIVFVVTLIVFLATAGTSGGLFAYKRVLQNELAAQEQTIRTLREDYDKNAEQAAVIKRAEELGIQVGAIEALLNGHVALTPLFDFLEAHTLKDVQFTSFNFSKADDGGLTVTLEATSNSYMTAALQREELKSNTLEAFLKTSPQATSEDKARYPISSFTISIPVLTEEGTVSFTLELALNPEALRYVRTVAGATSAPAPAAALEVSETPTAN